MPLRAPRAAIGVRGGGAVDREARLQALVLLIAVEVHDAGDGAKLALHHAGPVRELVQVVALHGELVLRAAGAAADAEILHALEKQARARDVRELGAKTRHDRVGGDLALVERLKGDEHAAGVE